MQGRAELLHPTGEDDEWRSLYRSIAYRYVPVEQADAYVENTIDQPRALLGVPLDGSKVLTWRMPVDDEDPTGIWARRYYLDGTIMAAPRRRRGFLILLHQDRGVSGAGGPTRSPCGGRA